MISDGLIKAYDLLDHGNCGTCLSHNFHIVVLGIYSPSLRKKRIKIKLINRWDPIFMILDLQGEVDATACSNCP